MKKQFSHFLLAFFIISICSVVHAQYDSRPVPQPIIKPPTCVNEMDRISTTEDASKCLKALILVMDKLSNQEEFKLSDIQTLVRLGADVNMIIEGDTPVFNYIILHADNLGGQKNRIKIFEILKLLVVAGARADVQSTMPIYGTPDSPVYVENASGWLPPQFGDLFDIKLRIKYFVEEQVDILQQKTEELVRRIYKDKKYNEVATNELKKLCNEEELSIVDPKKLKKLLSQNANPNVICDKENKTILIKSVIANRIDLVATLLDFDASTKIFSKPNKSEIAKSTSGDALGWAKRNKYQNIVELILEHNSRHYTEEFANVPHMQIELKQRNLNAEQTLRMLQYKESQPRAEISIQQLNDCLKKGANPSVRNWNFFPLITLYIDKGLKDHVAKLLEYNVDTSMLTNGQDALLYAQKKHQFEIADLILDYNEKNGIQNRE